MIVKNINNQYSTLFAEATEIGKKRGWLNDNEDISSLNEYFSIIRDLASADLKYTVLPLDEETFKINANIRNIEVPQSFKNGVGVQGDQVAEIIYFEIDRYFDSTDLNTQNIVFEWENSNNRQGLSKEYHRDLITVPDKIIFGWPLTNEITEKAGRIKFSVRFYSFNTNGDIVYSFSTKPQTITINESMDFDINESSAIIDVSEMIKNRLINSTNSNTTGESEIPVFRINIDEEQADLKNGEKTIQVQAYSNDSGIITYGLEEQKEDGAWTTKEPISAPSFDLTDDEKYQEGQLYYIKEGTNAYTILKESVFPEDKDVYEPFGIYTLKAAGTYRVIAKNRAGSKENYGYSNELLIPGPTTPPEGTDTMIPIILENSEKIIVVENNVDVEKESSEYKWTNDINSDEDVVNVASYKVSAEGIYKVWISNTRNNVTKTSTNPITYKVTEPAKWVENAFSISEASSEKNLVINIDKTLMKYDSIEATLYKKINSIDKDKVVDKIIDTSKTNIDFGKQGVGSYQIELTIKYNGSEAYGTIDDLFIRY